jgi:hypothetical protein
VWLDTPAGVAPSVTDKLCVISLSTLFGARRVDGLNEAVNGALRNSELVARLADIG